MMSVMIPFFICARMLIDTYLLIFVLHYTLLVTDNIVLACMRMCVCRLECKNRTIQRREKKRTIHSSTVNDVRSLSF